MIHLQHDFSIQVHKVSSLVGYLHERRGGICGPRTLKQAYANYWMMVMSTGLQLTDQEQQVIQRMAPLKVDWDIAYAWWKDHDA